MGNIKSKVIDKYRNISKNIGLWDATYAPIKNDLLYIRSKVFDMNTAYDLAGIFAQMVFLGLRLLTYGESNTDYSKEDVETMLSPIVDIFGDATLLGKFNTDTWRLTKSVFPFVSRLVREKNISDVKELEKHLRMVFIHSSGLFNIVLGRMMAADYCLYQYGMSDLRDWLSDEAIDVIDKSESEDVKSTRDNVTKIFKGTANFAPNRFIINMSILVNETNVGEIDYRTTNSVMAAMVAGIISRGHEHDCLKFMDGDGFMSLAHNALRFHHVEASQLDEDD